MSEAIIEQGEPVETPKKKRGRKKAVTEHQQELIATEDATGQAQADVQETPQEEKPSDVVDPGKTAEVAATTEGQADSTPAPVVAEAVPVQAVAERDAAAEEIAKLKRELAWLREKATRGFLVSEREYAALDVAQKLANLTPDVNKAEQEYNEAKAIADKKKKTWEGLQKQMQQVSTELTTTLSSGDYQPTLFRQPYPGDTHLEPPLRSYIEPVQKPVEIAPKPAPESVPEKPPEPVDRGGDMDLICFLKSSLTHNCGECDAEGLTESKIESLKESIEGDTVKDLEKFQMKHVDWPSKLKGFGEKWIDRLQDAHLAIRTKFPVPDSAEAEEAIASIVAVPEEAGPKITVEFHEAEDWKEPEFDTSESQVSGDGSIVEFTGDERLDDDEFEGDVSE